MGQNLKKSSIQLKKTREMNQFLQIFFLAYFPKKVNISEKILEIDTIGIGSHDFFGVDSFNFYYLLCHDGVSFLNANNLSLLKLL